MRACVGRHQPSSAQQLRQCTAPWQALLACITMESASSCQCRTADLKQPVAAADTHVCIGACCRLLGLSVQHIAAELSTGKVYSSQHPDKHGRPVFIIRTRRHLQGEPGGHTQLLHQLKEVNAAAAGASQLLHTHADVWPDALGSCMAPALCCRQLAPGNCPASVQHGSIIQAAARRLAFHSWARACCACSRSGPEHNV